MYPRHPDAQPPNLIVIKSSVHRFIQWQARLSRQFDRLLPDAMSVDGNYEFRTEYAISHLRTHPNPVVYDVGGGKNPYLSLELKRQLNATVVGLDISQTELDAAPPGVYDQTVCADLTLYQGRQDADFVICQTLLEHVRDVNKAFEALAGILKPGGVLLVFVPSRNAIFARLNLLLPEKLKRLLLFAIFPQTKRDQGFPSYYDRCTPAAFKKLAQEQTLVVIDCRLYYCSMYFSFFAPLHILWRTWLYLFKRVDEEKAAETFAMALSKTSCRTECIDCRATHATVARSDKVD